jgi:hypothetical protein
MGKFFCSFNHFTHWHAPVCADEAIAISHHNTNIITLAKHKSAQFYKYHVMETYS